ncbi:transposase [Nocardia sp. 2YAB30]|uniref:IS110 family transposase n=1 Tax=unclassified Nocardia TaxID=2637762 RepID=UPI003F95D0CE
MPQDAPSDYADTSDETVVLGVDTHKDTHVAFLVGVQGNALGHISFSTTSASCRQLLAWAKSFGTLRRAGVEGTSSYGTALTRYLQEAGLLVLEVNQPDKGNRRRRGKTDVIDAEARLRERGVRTCDTHGRTRSLHAAQQ